MNFFDYCHFFRGDIVMRIRTFMAIMAFFVAGVVLHGCSSTSAQTVTGELIVSEKTLPIKFYEIADQGIVVYKATNEAEFNEHWEHFRLSDPPEKIDWENQAVIFLGIVESGTCPLQFKSAEVNEVKTELLFHLEGNKEQACTDDATPRTMVIALDASEISDVAFVKIDDYFGINPEVEFHEMTVTNEDL